MSLTLIQHFGVVSLQGLPDGSHRRFGVPVGGAFDTESYALVNAFVGLDLTEPAWELSMAQATFRAERSGLVGVAGAAALIRLGGETFETNTVFSVATGDEFVLESPSAGARVYVAFGHQHRKSGWRMRLEEPTESVANRRVLRVIDGPQADRFDRRVLDWPFTVSRTGNRVGVRLEQSIGAHRIELPSEPQCVGTIQISNDGTPILIGPDGPTIGGYPKIAVVISADIPRIAQLRPGDQVRFERCSIDAARLELAASKARFAKRLQLLNLRMTIS